MSRGGVENRGQNWFRSVWIGYIGVVCFGFGIGPVTSFVDLVAGIFLSVAEVKSL